MSLAEFHSALDYTEVRDFAYPEFHPLFYGVVRPESQVSEVSVDREEEADSWGTPTQKFELVGLEPPQEVLDNAGGSVTASSEYLHIQPNDIYSRAVALFDFEPENDNEISLVEGQIIWVSYRHGQGWLVAEDLETGATGLIPEEYVQLMPGDEDEWVDVSDGAGGRVQESQNDEVPAVTAVPISKGTDDGEARDTSTTIAGTDIPVVKQMENLQL